MNNTEPERIYTLVPSTNRGRYALDDPETGSDLTCGEYVSLFLGNHWVHGRVEHSSRSANYPDASGVYALTGVTGRQVGYYFIADRGGICGLCAGMKVKKGLRWT